MGLQEEARQKFPQDKNNTGKTEANGMVRQAQDLSSTRSQGRLEAQS